MWRYATRLAPATRGFSTSALRLANTPFYDEFANVLKNDLKKSMLQKDNARYVKFSEKLYCIAADAEIFSNK